MSRRPRPPAPLPLFSAVPKPGAAEPARLIALPPARRRPGPNVRIFFALPELLRRRRDDRVA